MTLPVPLRTGILTIGLLTLMLGGTLALAAGIPNLGKPTSATPPYLPLGGFRREGKPLRLHFREEILVFGVAADDHTSAETWPLAKALSRFGTIVGAHPVDRQCAHPNQGIPFCRAPFLDLSRAHMRSRYVAFVYHDLIGTGGTCLSPRRLSAEERRVLQRNHVYWETGYQGKYCWQVNAPGGDEYDPIVALGGYVQAGDNVVVPGAFLILKGSTNPSQPGQVSAVDALPIDTVLARLRSGIDVSGSQMVYDVNAEANLITALICHGDSMQPKRVCTRLAIRQILRHVR